MEQAGGRPLRLFLIDFRLGSGRWLVKSNNIVLRSCFFNWECLNALFYS